MQITTYANGRLAEAILEAAGRVGCRPQQLTLALLRGVIEGGLVDAVLDGDDPARSFPLAGKRAARERGLSPYQAAVLRTLAARLRPDGTVCLSVRDIAMRADIPWQPVAAVLGRLRRLGMISMIEKGAPQGHRAAVHRIERPGLDWLEAGDA